MKTLFISANQIRFFNLVQELRNDFETKHKSAPEFLLMHPEDYPIFQQQLKDAAGNVLYSIPIINTRLVEKGLPKFVKS
jgi:hypothetical protein